MYDFRMVSVWCSVIQEIIQDTIVDTAPKLYSYAYTNITICAAIYINITSYFHLKLVPLQGLKNAIAYLNTFTKMFDMQP